MNQTLSFLTKSLAMIGAYCLVDNLANLSDDKKKEVEKLVQANDRDGIKALESKLLEEKKQEPQKQEEHQKSEQRPQKEHDPDYQQYLKLKEKFKD